MVDPEDKSTIDALSKELNDASEGVKIVSFLGDRESNEKINSIINWSFYSIIAITMFLCFFSLSASMSANLYE